ncbi:ABC transporter ATP-binding protein [Pelagibacteraceae bacterium]|nr:ABC transporter ATP-binding protein [Pelagibacteraceae bacterium]
MGHNFFFKMSLVKVKNLTISFKQYDNIVYAVRGISFEINQGESLGIVGESGSGKSVTFMTVMGLMNSPTSIVEADLIEIDGINVLDRSKENIKKIRGKIAAMVFQDSMTSFDPLHTIGYQIAETIVTHKNINNKEALKQAEHLLERVEIQNANKVLNYYPHQLSGGMLQRAMIAMALSCEPKLLIADEPTTALDVTVQAQILQLLTDIQQETNMSFVMITHDLGVIAETVDRVLVMYSGKIMENSNVFDIFNQPKHPYTKALIDSIPGKEPGKKRLKEISKEDRDLWYAGT